MKTWKKYLFIYIPIGIFCCIINFCVKNNDTPPYVREYSLHELDKKEYSVKDWVSGENLGKATLCKNGEDTYFSIISKSTSGKLMVGQYEELYNYQEIIVRNIIIEKHKCKNLEFYSAPIGDWHTIIIISLYEYDCHEYYKSDNKNRYLFYLQKNGDYNFSTRDESVYDLYSAFGAGIEDMRYAAILE